MSYAISRSAPVPLGAINMTPLIDILLVLLVMLVLTVPPITNRVSVDLPSSRQAPYPAKRDVNRLVLTAGGAMLWNGNPLGPEELAPELDAMRALVPLPELQFAPDANVSYDLTAHTINRIKQSGISRFGFVGNDRFREFGKAGG